MYKIVADDMKAIELRLARTQVFNKSNFSFTGEKDSFKVFCSQKMYSTGDFVSLHNMIIDKELTRYERQYLDLLCTYKFTFLMIDRAIVQCFYEFKENKLIRQTMAFYQSPFDVPYQSAPIKYRGFEENFSEKKDAGSLIMFRFEYNPKQFKEHIHPNVHFTLGDYDDCRIAVKSPLTLSDFFDYIIKNFYTPVYRQYIELSKKYRCQEKQYGSTIYPLERKSIHFSFE